MRCRELADAISAWPLPVGDGREMLGVRTADSHVMPTLPRLVATFHAFSRVWYLLIPWSLATAASPVTHDVMLRALAASIYSSRDNVAS